ncbi:endo-1,4-beta-xylanase [Vibrio vulnificus]|nr:endo-1,4-beta-xylanase [Vibrio vulnificus]
MKRTLLAFAIASGIAMPAVAETTQIDVLGVYTKATSEWFEQDQLAAIQHRFNVGNVILKNSGLDIKVNLVATKEYNFDSQAGMKKSQKQALNALTPSRAQDPIFSDIESERKKAGADMVAMFRNLDLKNTPDYDAKKGLISCGLAWVIPASDWRSNPRYAKSRMYSHSYMNQCGDDTFIHELGHNWGLNHAHEQYENTPHFGNGTEKDAYGYGVKDKFATTMAYGFLFGVRGRSYTFSTPDKQCEGTPCGKKDYANAVRAIGLSAPHVASIYASKAATPEDGTTDTVTPPAVTTGKNQYLLESPRALPDATQLELPFDVNYQGELTKTTIRVNIEHQFIGDVSVSLVAPSGKQWSLKESNGRDRGNRYHVLFTLNDVEKSDVLGQWKVLVSDDYEKDTGIIKEVELLFK